MTASVRCNTTVIYDGFELDGAAPVHVVPCAGCSAPMDLPLSGLLGSFERMKHVDPVLAERLAVAASLTPVAWTGLPDLRTRDGFDAYLARIDCRRCGAEHLVVLGYGEFQPARYLATVEAIVVDPG